MIINNLSSLVSFPLIKVLSQCGPMLIRLPNDYIDYSSVVECILTFAIDVLSTKRVRPSLYLSMKVCEHSVAVVVVFLSRHKFVHKLLLAYCNVVFICQQPFSFRFIRISVNLCRC
jgi:hypothetical protein